MSHHIYSTEAIILANNSVGESDKIVQILTADLGLITARAQGIRKEASKMRPALQEFSLSIVSLVAGKSGWRLTGAVLEQSFVANLKKNNNLRSMAKIFNLIRRLTPKEEVNIHLFEIVLDGLNSFDELILVARILHELGYFVMKKPVKSMSRYELLQNINEAIVHANL